MDGVKGLVVLANKNEAEGLKKALNTLVRQEGCKVCECFDILVIDGGSKDASKEIAETYSMKYGCINFKVQDVKGGVGPARIEAIRYALDRGYRFIVWGDSGNEYSENYMKELIKVYRSMSCQVVSGSTKVRHSSVWTRLLFWYHLYHELFSFVGRRHAPGNNKLVDVETYTKALYPPSSRSDDFYFSLLASKKGIKFCHSRNAFIKVSMPAAFRDVIAWERWRVKGLIEGAYMMNIGIPPILPAWIMYALSPLLLLLSAYLLVTPASISVLKILSALFISLYLLALAGIGLKLEMLSKHFYEKPVICQGLIGLLGMYLHSIFTTYYAVKYYLVLRKQKRALQERAIYVLRKFRFDPEILFNRFD